MADVKQVLAASTAMTITVSSMASGSARESTAVDNTSNKYLDALVMVQFAKGSPASGQKQVRIYAYGSEDGSTYEDPCTGSDAAITLENPPVTRIVRTVSVRTTLTVTYEAAFTIAWAFGGILPLKWGIIIENQTGVAITGSASYSGIYYTVT